MKPGANAGGLLAVATLAIVLGTLSVALRLYTRKAILRQMWVDDWLAMASWVCLMGLAIQNFHSISTGLGSRFHEIPPQGLPAFFRDLWLGLVIYQTALLFTKSTLFFQFYRILRQTHRDKLQVFYIGIMTVIAGWQVSQIFVHIFFCIPVQAAWDKTIQGKCQSMLLMRNVSSAGNIATDLIILLLPFPVFWHLALPRNEKIAVFSIFGLGLFTCVVAVLRLTAVPFRDADVSWDTVRIVSWTTAEVLTGVVIASLATLRPLVGHFVPAWATSDASKASGGTCGANYRLGNMPSRGAAGVSSSDGESALIYPSRMFSSAAWLDLAESAQDSGVRAPEPVRITKSWSASGPT